jgi:hypothetical protein
MKNTYKIMGRTIEINQKLQKIKNEVIAYLNTHPDERKSIAFYGKGGEGKTLLFYILESQFKENGYKLYDYIDEDNDNPISLGMDTRRRKRSNKWVLETCNESILKDDRFIVFDFTK